MALDEPREGDQQFETEGVTWLVAGEDQDSVLGRHGIRVDHVESWYGAGFALSRKGQLACC